MKRIYLIFIAIAIAGAMSTSCNVDAKFTDYIPTHALQQMVKSATAICGEEVITGDVDNATHKITFVFVNSDFSDVVIKIEYASRTILKEGAFDEKNLDLTNPYTFVLNNQEEDFTYTISAEVATIIQIDRTQCSVIVGLANDALITETDAHLVSCLFDGKWMSKKEAYPEVSYLSFGWTVAAPAPVGHGGNSFTFDVGEPVRLSRMRTWPYWPYSNNTPAIFEIYAWPLPGEPSGDWTNWVKIGEADDSEKWQIVAAAEAGSENDLTKYGTTVEFLYGNVPEARYYRYKMVKNFYAAFETAMNAYWSARVNYCTISEMELWKFNLGEE